MWSSSRCNLRNAFLFASTLAAVVTAGCGSTCIQGFFNGGNGGGFVSSGTPQACPVPNVTGTMNAVALKTVACENCSAATGSQHLFVTVRSIQLRPSPTPGEGSPDWVELAPHLADAPVQIDLIGDSSEILVQNAPVPAGTYEQLRVLFFSPSTMSAEELFNENACGLTRSNCLVTADGHVHPLRWPGDVPELVTPLGTTQSDSLLVLPGTKMDLQIHMQPQLAFVSGAEGLKLQFMLAGQADAIRQSFAAETSPR